jgi:nitrate reductase gamma subunit
MEAWIEFARGPLFRISVAVLVLGSAYRLVTTVVRTARAYRRAADRRLPWRDVAAATVRWLVPIETLRHRPWIGVASLLLHLGVVVTPLFLAGHAVLLFGPATQWPTLPPRLADVLTIAGIVGALGLIGMRLATRAGRALTRTGHVLTLGVLATVLVAGFVASHPGMTAVPARAALLVHILAGDLVLVMVPTTRIVHCLLAPFMRLTFAIGWQFPADTGRHVAVVLAKEDQPV